MEICVSLTEAEILKLKLMLKLKNFLLINLNNLTYYKLKERQSQQASSQLHCTSNSPVDTANGKVNNFITSLIRIKSGIFS